MRLLLYDFLVLIETWLKNEVFNSELGFYNYDIFKCNRSNLTSNSSRGEGVLISVNNTYASKLISILYGSVEQVFVFVVVDNEHEFILGTFYFSETSPLVLLLHLFFNKSLSVGVFSHYWKSSFLLTIFKLNNKVSVTNYRPISKFSLNYPSYLKEFLLMSNMDIDLKNRYALIC